MKRLQGTSPSVARFTSRAHASHHCNVPEIPPLPDATILMVEVGSTAHGTGIPGGEDHDEMGVVIEPPEQVLGLDEPELRTVMQRTQPEGARSGPGDVDRTLHSLRRFARLAASGNPSVLMALWAPVLHITDLGRELRELGDAFVGRHVIPRYRGYMAGQIAKLRDGGRPDLVGERTASTPSTRCTRPASATKASSSSRPGTSTSRSKVSRPSGCGPSAGARSPSTSGGRAAAALDARLDALADDEDIPAEPDGARIETWLVSAHLRSWGRA